MSRRIIFDILTSTNFDEQEFFLHEEFCELFLSPLFLWLEKRAQKILKKRNLIVYDSTALY